MPCQFDVRLSSYHEVTEKQMHGHYLGSKIKTRQTVRVQIANRLLLKTPVPIREMALHSTKFRLNSHLNGL